MTQALDRPRRQVQQAMAALTGPGTPALPRAQPRPRGCGKPCMINIGTRLVSVDGGVIPFDGKSLKARPIGGAFQHCCGAPLSRLRQTDHIACPRRPASLPQPICIATRQRSLQTFQLEVRR